MEFNPNYVVSCSTCEKGLDTDRDKAYVLELGNGTKILCYMRGAFGRAQMDELVSEAGEQANLASDQQANSRKVRLDIHKLENRY